MTHRRTAILTLLTATLVGAGCGADDSVTAPVDDATSGDDRRIEAVVVESAPAPDRPVEWLLIDVMDGTTIEGASQLAVEAPLSEIGCGEEGRLIVIPHFVRGQVVSFEPVETDASPPPFLDSTAWQSAVRVGARELRVPCSADSDEVAATLAAQRAKWDAAGIESYQYTMFWGVFLGTAGDYRVTVVDGRPAELHRLDGAEVLHGPGTEVPKSIDEVFDVLERELAADRVEAEYHAEFGYPVEVLVDRMANGVDDELEIRISDFSATS